MNHLSLQERFALIALNGFESSRKTSNAHLADRCLLISQLFDFILNEKMILTETGYHFITSGFPCDKTSEKTAFEILKVKEDNRSLAGWVSAIENLPQKVIGQYAEELIDEMINTSLISEIPSLLECDFTFRSENIKSREYRSSYTQYHAEIESIRAEILGGSVISDAAFYLVWLLKQNGDLIKLFTQNEMVHLLNYIPEISKENQLVHDLFEINIKGDIIRGWKSFLTFKQSSGQTQTGVGVVSKIPIFQKKESIFIETDKMFPNDEERVKDVKNLLESNGHICEVKSVGAVSLMEIDNVLYELVPDAIRNYVINIHGVRLRRYVI
ncbi:MAG: hypothetical protein QM657_04215 [Lacrimispora sp.]|uniref:hypothetical protein n=1 Tax=Lacrimispora sp. TaxID=2719234 RepID=UPI0039E5E72F